MKSTQNDRPYRPPENTALDILYQDQALLVLNKPAGLLSVPGRGVDKQDCLSSRARQHYPDALTVHRLDMETSGIILMARGATAQRQLGRLFEQRRVVKRYLAVVAGMPASTGTIELPLRCDWPRRPRQMVNHVDGKAAVTHFRRLHYDRARHCSVVELQPLTGRTHQLRVHLRAIGHAIVGDRLYGDDNTRQAAERLLLHASHLSFTHPSRDGVVDIHSPAPFLEPVTAAGEISIR